MRPGKKTASLLGPAFVFRTHDFNKLGSLSFNDKYFFGLLSFQEEDIENLGEINGEALFKISLNRELSVKS